MEGNGSDHHVERQVKSDEHDGDADGLLKSFQKNGTKDGEQDEGDGHLAAHPGRREGVLHDVRGGIGGGERHGDHEIRGGKAEQDQDEDLAAPFWEEALQHADAALAVGAGLGDARIDGQGAEQGDEDEDERSYRGEQAGGEEGDAGLIAEGRKIIDAGEAHDSPPGVDRVGGAISALG